MKSRRIYYYERPGGGLARSAWDKLVAYCRKWDEPFDCMEVLKDAIGALPGCVLRYLEPAPIDDGGTRRGASGAEGDPPTKENPSPVGEG